MSCPTCLGSGRVSVRPSRPPAAELVAVSATDASGVSCPTCLPLIASTAAIVTDALKTMRNPPALWVRLAKAHSNQAWKSLAGGVAS